MIFLKAFIIGGLICVLGQFLLDYFKLLPVHIVVIFVVLGSFLEIFNIYDMLIEFSGAGAMLPISSFGHSLTDCAISTALNSNYLGIFTGVFQTTSLGISFAILSAFIISLIFRPRG